MSQSLKQLGEGLSAHLLAEMRSRGLTVEGIAAASDGLISAIEARGLRDRWKNWNLRYVCAVATSLGVEVDEFIRAAREGNTASTFGGEVPPVVGGEAGDVAIEGVQVAVDAYLGIRQQIVDLWRAVADLAESQAATGDNLKVMAGSLRDLAAELAGEASE